jgi:hypothetical protein
MLFSVINFGVQPLRRHRQHTDLCGFGAGAPMSEDDQDQRGSRSDPADPPWISPAVAFAITSFAVGGALLGFWLPCHREQLVRQAGDQGQGGDNFTKQRSASRRCSFSDSWS